MGDCEQLKVQVATQDSFTYTATKSIFSFSTTDGVSFNATFTSPIFPNDFKRHSITATYLNVDVFSNDGKPHKVQVYNDISGEFADTDNTVLISWEDTKSTDGKVFSHKVHRQTQAEFTEDANGNGAVARWGDWLLSTGTDTGFSWQQGADVDVRGQFTGNGKLTSEGDTNYRAISDNWPVFALSHDLGSVGSNNSASALFTIGLFQEQAILFEGKSGNTSLPSYWLQYYDNAEAAAAAHYLDYSYADKEMTKSDQRIQSDAVAKGGQDLATIVNLAYRQAYAGCQLVGTEAEPYFFLKEVSSDGNVQTVDVMFPAFPVFLYDNPELIKLLVNPLYENQEAGYYPNSWAIHDLGGSYPNATGHNDGKDERMSVEEPGNMLIMSLAYAQKTGDNDWLSSHYPIMKQWNSYLKNGTLIPTGNDGLSTDDFAGSHDNQTNLALKGIIGIAAMAEIAKLTGNDDDATSFRATAEDYISQWQGFGINSDANPPHSMLFYGDTDTHGLLYNLYADKLLGLDLVPKEIYDMQDAFYQTIGNQYGVPLDSRWLWTKLDWELWSAAYCSRETLDYFTSRIAKWINETTTNCPMTDLYETKGGDYADEFDSDGNEHRIVFQNRPVVGGVFAPLLL